MDGLPPTAPHWIGLWAALAGLAALIVLLSRAGVRRRLGKRTWPLFGCGILVLAAIALFGSGVYGTASRFSTAQLVVLRGHFEQEKLRAATERALEVASSDEFVRFWSRSNPKGAEIDAARLGECVEIKRLSYSQLKQHGIRLSPEDPPDDHPMFLITYYDPLNFGLHLLGIGARSQQARFQFILDLHSGRSLVQLTLLELLTAASSDQEKLQAIKLMRMGGEPKISGWIRKQLDSIADREKSPEVLAALNAFRSEFFP